MYTWNHTPEINISEVGEENGQNVDETGIEKMLKCYLLKPREGDMEFNTLTYFCIYFSIILKGEKVSDKI